MSRIKFYVILLVMILGQFGVKAFADEILQATPIISTPVAPQTTQLTTPPMAPQVVQTIVPQVVPQVIPSAQRPQNNCKEVIFSQKVYPLNAIDPTILTNAAASFYPGLRGGNQMIVYTPAFGSRTNTNEFGGEAIVNGNIVTALSGADSIIPFDGLVISGHGVAKKWMNENIIVGAKVYVDKDCKNLTVYITSDSFLYGAKAKIKEANEIMNYYRASSYLYDYKRPYAYVEQAEDYLIKAEKDTKNVQKYSALAIEAANSALATVVPYKQDELKGVWIRPTETSEAAIINTLDKIKAAGLNNIFLETYFHGKTIFPSKTMENYQFTAQNEKFVGFDPLKIWIEEAHKRGIKVNIWFETFYVGNKNPCDNPHSIIGVNPSWANTTKREFDSSTPTPSLSEHGGYFIDPANPDVQQFLEELLAEIITNYKPDGINLDYIRYPQSIAAKFAGYDLSNWGYTEYARADFKAHYGIDPIEICPSDAAWALWDRYRQDKITQFVLRVSKLTKPKGILLTTVIFPDRQKALETKQQDWKTWSALGYVDGFTPLLLTCDAKTASTMMQDVIRNKSKDTALYSGLFITFMGGSSEDLVRQIHEARKLDAKGVIVFDYAHFEEKYMNTLAASIFDPTQQLAQQFQPQAQSTQAHRRRKFFTHRG